MNDLRVVERRENEQWVKVSWSDLKEGDIFRMFELTGEPVLGVDYSNVFLALSDSYIDEKTDQWMIQV